MCLTRHLFGDDGGREPRVPIPNTTVKPSSADGTWTEGSWESRTLPSTNKTFSNDSSKRFFVIEKRHASRKRQDCHGLLLDMKKGLMYDCNNI